MFKLFLKDVFDLIYPKNCNGCYKVLAPEEHLVCVTCLVNLPKTDSHKHPLEHLNAKFWGKLPVKNTYSFLKFGKKGTVQELLHNLKYRKKPEVATFLGMLYGHELKSSGLSDQLDVLIAVPLHPKRQAWRGYNQAEEFCKGLQETSGLVYVPDVLERIKETSTQTKKSRLKRYENLKDAFRVKQEEFVKGKRVALADDVLTTGSTFLACGEQLIKAGCSELSIITIASA